MKTKANDIQIKGFKPIFAVVITTIILIFNSLTASAHCESYDGLIIKDTVKALKNNNVTLVLKLITVEQDKEINPLFHKPYALKSGDKEVYEIDKKHFPETLVRLHQQTQGAPYTGLKPAGSTKQIIQMTDNALLEEDIEGF